MCRSRILICSATFVICFLTGVPSSSSLSFNFSSFPDDAFPSDIKLQPDAYNRNGSIELTKDTLSETVTNSAGRASYKKELFLLWDAQTKQLSDFTTRFVFNISRQKQYSTGDGYAFFLTAPMYAVPVNSFGGSLGLFSWPPHPAKSPGNTTVAVEFDTFSNDQTNDPYGNHVGIDINSVNSTVTANWSDFMGKTTSWVTYNSTTHNLSVFLYRGETQELSDAVLILNYTIDLRTVLPEKVEIGFSAATGANIETHTLLSWSFRSTLQPRKKSNIAVIAISIAGAAVLILILVAALGSRWFLTRRRTANGKDEDDVWILDEAMDNEFERGRGPKRFTYPELARATGDFSDEGKLGEGGFGSVYRGVLKQPKLEVAVKRISKSSQQGRKEYMAEVKIISRLRHRNLVQLVGWCHDRAKELLLVYELVPNGSLNSYLHGGSAMTLEWGVRLRVTLGLASALLYLHEEWEQCVVHRDVKPSNVMLDSEFNAKLGDFGLARLIDHDGGPQTSTVLVGTRGYMAPEYVYTGKASKESDVYSFGVVALELASGRMPIFVEENGPFELVRWVWELYGRKMILKAADERLQGEFDRKQMEYLMVVGLWCAHPDPKARPSMKQAISALNFEAPLPELPPAMPVPTFGASL